MKKFWSFPMGLLVGVALTFSVVVQAEEIKNYIGARIEGQFPVTVNGVKLEDPGLVVDGKSYLPSRTIANMFNAEISFDADLGIDLKTNAAVTRSENMTVPKELTREEIIDDIESIENRLTSYEAAILTNKKYLTGDSEKDKEIEEAIRMAEENKAKLEAEKAALEAQLEAMTTE